MRIPPREGLAEAFDHARGIECARADQQNQIYQVPDPAIRRLLLRARFASDVLPAPFGARRRSCTVELVSSLAPFQRVDDLRNAGVFASANNLPPRQFALTLGVMERVPKRGLW